MKAFTLYQPWASLVVIGAKPFEFRGWNFMDRYPRMEGERIVIHASARPMRHDEVRAIAAALHAGGDAAAATCLKSDLAMSLVDKLLSVPLHWWKDIADAPLAAGLGTAVLGEPRNGVEIAQREFGFPVAEELPGLPGFDSDREEHANWGWPMLDVERWETPVPMRGFQGFWNWPKPENVGL